MNMSSNELAIYDLELEQLQNQHKAIWEDGDYAAFSRYMEAGAIEVLDQWDLAKGSRLIDVGCGSGQTAIPAAKLGMQVTGVDIAENLVSHAKKRAERGGLSARFLIGDAQDLPCEDAQFDIAISMFGAMFAPHADKVVDEFSRVLVAGGKLFMANWTPQSMPAQMFKCLAQVNPPKAGTVPPSLWGDETTVKQRLFDTFTDIKLTRKRYPQWRYPFDSSQLVELFRTHFGPVKQAFDKLDSAGKKQLRQQLKQIYEQNSNWKNGVLTITGGEYLEVIATRR